ncbi:hypothetical protein EYF80_040523 [Liparis tanakae]|uniref:Uncharacterized protein n=1 Tax=Liparis tanakae TaxID=230148 RepID=A0A4Z2G6V8_9TELE|nr:hypothetical protein EYF80_040523 [Liparis tanakae]
MCLLGHTLQYALANVLVESAAFALNKHRNLADAIALTEPITSSFTGCAYERLHGAPPLIRRKPGHLGMLSPSLACSSAAPVRTAEQLR